MGEVLIKGKVPVDFGTTDHEMLYFDDATKTWTKTGSGLTWNDGTQTLAVSGVDALIDISAITIAAESFTNILKVNNKCFDTDFDDKICSGFIKSSSGNDDWLALGGRLANSSILRVGVDADARARWSMEADGMMTWGSGAVIGDVTLYRSALNTLKTDDNFIAALKISAAELQIDNININGNIISSNTSIAIEPSGDLTVNVGSDSIHLIAGTETTIGNGGSTVLKIETTGDTFWVGAGTGLPYGHMYVDGTQSIIVALTLNTPAEVEDDGTTSIEDGWLAGDSNLITFPTGGTEHFIAITKPGVYHITWNLSFKMVTAGANTQIHAGLTVDSTTFRRDRCEAHRTISNNTDTGNMAGTCTIDLPNGNEELSLWIENTTNSNDAEVFHGSLTAVMVGGT